MGTIIVIQYVTLDGVIEDPDGSRGTSYGGWAFRDGPPAVAEDKFHLGPLMDSGVLLLGRATWEMFAARWPGRPGAFAAKMNAIPKVVASRSAPDLSAWSGSRVLEGALVEGAEGLREHADVIVVGSTSIVRALMDADLVDEYRLLIVPEVVGAGERLFEPPTARRLALLAAEQHGSEALVRYGRSAGAEGTSS